MSAGHHPTARRLLAACTGGVLALCASLYAAPAQAQVSPCESPSCETLISNIRGANTSNQILFGTGVEYAQSFRTGDNSAGYTLQSVVVSFTAFTSRTTTSLMAEVREAAGNNPGSTVIATLDTPTSLPDGTLTAVDFELTVRTGENVTLSAMTTYHLVLRHTDAGNITWLGTSRTLVDTGDDNWSFPVGSQVAIGSGWSGGSPDGTSKMQVRGTAIADTTAPTLDTAAVNGNTLTLTYDEALDTASVPAATDFTVRVGSTPQTVSTVAISGMEVRLTLSGAVTSGDTVTVTYAVPGSNPVQDAAGNDAAALSARAVTNNTPPMFVGSGSLFGDMLVLFYDDALDESSMPAATAFTLTGTVVAVSAVAISDQAVTLTLSAPVSPTDTVTVSYMKPGTDPLQDADGNEADSFTGRFVNNFTPPVPTGVMAASNAVGELEVSWTEPDDLSNVRGYQVQYRIDGGANWLPADPGTDSSVTAVTAGGTLTHPFTGLAAGMYDARVRSFLTLTLFGGIDVYSAWVETGSAVRVGPLAFPSPTQANLVYTVNVAIDPAVTLPAATGGTPTISYTLTGPNNTDLSEVPGLMFDATNRQLSGTPTTAGTTTLTYTATDSATPTPATVTQTFTITINEELTLPTQDNLAYTVGTAIDNLELPAATGGVGTISYALTGPGAGDLPAGLAFNAGTRVLSGMPTTAGGPTTLTYTATDMDTPPVVRTQTFTITVSTGLAFPAQDDLAYTAGTAIDDLELPAATGGTGTISYTLTGPSAGALPAGLTFNAGTRVLSGTPTTAGGPTTLTYTATDSATTPTMATQTFTVTINAALALDLTTLTVPDYGAGTAITLTLPAATGGTTPISYTLTGPSAGPLPAGLTFNATTRVLSGTPTAVGTTTLTYTATDAATTPVEVMDTFDVTVLPVVTITQGTTPVIEGTDATFTVTATPAPSAALTVNVNVTQSGMFMGTAPTSLTVGTSGSGTLTVPTVDDTTDEVAGSITAMLAAGTGYIVGSQSSATVTVNDNDG